MLWQKSKKDIFMEITEQQFRTQLSEARNIESVKLKEWSDKLKQLLPV